MLTGDTATIRMNRLPLEGEICHQLETNPPPYPFPSTDSRLFAPRTWCLFIWTLESMPNCLFIIIYNKFDLLSFSQRQQSVACWLTVNSTARLAVVHLRFIFLSKRARAFCLVLNANLWLLIWFYLIIRKMLTKRQRTILLWQVSITRQ